ncbi:MAG: NifU family protein [Bacteriovoracaceae bacterium]
MNHRNRILKRSQNLMYHRDEVFQGEGLVFLSFLYQNHQLELFFLFQDGHIKEGGFRRVEGDTGELDALVDAYLQLIHGKKLKDFSLLSSREIESFLRDENHLPVILDQNLLAELDKLLLKVKNSVYNLARLHSGEGQLVFLPNHFLNLSLVKKIEAIESVLDLKIRPTLIQDQGNIELLDVDDTSLIMAYKGACGSCPSSQSGTLDFIQRTLREELLEPNLTIMIEE